MGRQRSERDDAKEPVAGRGCLFPYLVSVALLLSLIAYVAALVAARTDGFRSFVEKRVERVVGMPMVVERVRAMPSLDLIIERIGSKDGLTAGKPGLQIGQAVCRWRIRSVLGAGGSAIDSLELNDVYLSFAAEKGGVWQPAGPAPAAARVAEWLGVFVPMAPAPEPKQKSVPPDSSLERWIVEGTCHLRNVRMIWWDGDGELAHVAGLDADIVPLRAGRRELQYRFVTAESAARRGGIATNDVRVEFICSGGKVVALE